MPTQKSTQSAIDSPQISAQCPLFTLTVPLILASSSPRRQQFMQEWGVPFLIDVASGVEPSPNAGECPDDYVRRAARAKGSAVATRHAKKIVLAADTVVALGERILGKPRNADDALAMLTMLAGNMHHVISAVYLSLPNGEEHVFSVSTEVQFAPCSEVLLRAYIRTGEPMDKAGAYAIQGQGAFLVQKIHGSWTAVVGLPVTELSEFLMQKKLLLPFSHN